MPNKSQLAMRKTLKKTGILNTYTKDFKHERIADKIITKDDKEEVITLLK